jgi:DNA polymerase I
MNQATYIKTQSGLDAAIGRMENYHLLGCDIETTGLDPRSDKMRLLTVGSNDETIIIDCAHVNPAPIFPLLQTRTLIFHNGLFDLQFLMPMGLEPEQVRDTYLASRVLNAGVKDVKNGLVDCVDRYFNIKLDKTEQACGWEGELSASQLRYAVHDVQPLIPLYLVMQEEAEENGLEWTLEIENECLPAVAWMSGNGVPFNTHIWEEQLVKAEEGRKRSQEILDFLAPKDPGSLFESESIWNWSSSQSVIEVLKLVTGKKDFPSSDDAALASIDHPIADELRTYRTLSSRVERYGRSWIDGVIGGRLYPKWSQIGSVKKDSEDVGRLSCYNPCFNQIPRMDGEEVNYYRKAVEAPEGHSILKCDFSSIHFRIACRLCWEDAMIEAFARGEDIHKLTARLMYQLPPNSPVTKEQRQIAKSATYMFLYGGGAERARVYFLQEAGINKPLEWSRDIWKRWHKALPKISQWHVGAKEPRMETRTRSGRRRIIREEDSITIRLNSPVLGTEADGLKRSLGLMWKRRKLCPEARLIIANHDETVLEVKQGYEQKAASWQEKAMQDGMAPFIDPIPADKNLVESSFGQTWAG